MDHGRVSKKVFESKPEGRWIVRLRFETAEDAANDLREMKFKNGDRRLWTEKN
jgi:hypothetical protein